MLNIYNKHIYYKYKEYYLIKICNVTVFIIYVIQM